MFPDNILREKVNVQVEEFRGTIGTLLDEQFHRIKHLIRLSSDLPQNQVGVQNISCSPFIHIFYSESSNKSMQIHAKESVSLCKIKKNVLSCI